MRFSFYFLFILISANVYSQADTSLVSMAILKVNRNVDATINDKVIFTIKPNQDFVYCYASHMAFIKTMQAGCIPDSLVKITNKPDFKFTCPRVRFKLEKEDDLLVACEEHNVKVQPILDSIVVLKSEQGLLNYWSLKKYMDGAAAEIYFEVLFGLINSWNDEKLNHFLRQQNEVFLANFCKTITQEIVTWPICKVDQYYLSYYPKSWIVIKRYK